MPPVYHYDNHKNKKGHNTPRLSASTIMSLFTEHAEARMARPHSRLQILDKFVDPDTGSINLDPKEGYYRENPGKHDLLKRNQGRYLPEEWMMSHFFEQVLADKINFDENQRLIKTLGANYTKVKQQLTAERKEYMKKRKERTKKISDDLIVDPHSSFLPGGAPGEQSPAVPIQKSAPAKLAPSPDDADLKPPADQAAKPSKTERRTKLVAKKSTDRGWKSRKITFRPTGPVFPGATSSAHAQSQPTPNVSPPVEPSKQPPPSSAQAEPLKQPLVDSPAEKTVTLKQKKEEWVTEFRALGLDARYPGQPKLSGPLTMKHSGEVSGHKQWLTRVLAMAHESICGKKGFLMLPSAREKVKIDLPEDYGLSEFQSFSFPRHSIEDDCQQMLYKDNPKSKAFQSARDKMQYDAVQDYINKRDQHGVPRLTFEQLRDGTTSVRVTFETTRHLLPEVARATVSVATVFASVTFTRAPTHCSVFVFAFKRGSAQDYVYRHVGNEANDTSIESYIKDLIKLDIEEQEKHDVAVYQWATAKIGEMPGKEGNAPNGQDNEDEEATGTEDQVKTVASTEEESTEEGEVASAKKRKRPSSDGGSSEEDS